ncbi:metallophosphoesterase family protein [Pseudomonadota bacterium]
MLSKTHKLFSRAKILQVAGNHDSIPEMVKAKNEFERKTKRKDRVFCTTIMATDYIFEDKQNKNIYVMLNTQKIGKDGRPLEGGNLSSKQVQWFEKQITYARSKSLTPLVFMHHPCLNEKETALFFTETIAKRDGRDEFFENPEIFLKLIENIQVFVGHYHQSLPVNSRKLTYIPSVAKT